MLLTHFQIPHELLLFHYYEYNDPFNVYFAGEIFVLKPIEEISVITHLGSPILLTIIAEEVRVTRNEPPSMATTVQIALFLPERINSSPYFENDQYVSHITYENASVKER